MEERKRRPENLFSVRAACERVGIGPSTLRAWELRYSAVMPARTSKGQRRYTGADLERLSLIVELCNKGHAISTIAKLPSAQLKAILSSGPTVAKAPKLKDDLIETCEKSIRSFDLQSLADFMTSRRNALGARGFVLEVMGPITVWMGSKILSGEMTVAHEHAMSAIIRSQALQLLAFGSAKKRRGDGNKHFVLATPEDDLHENGILFSAVLLSHYGISNHMLGANLPMLPLATAARAVRADIVVLGNTSVPACERSIALADYLTDLHQHLPVDVEVWIGGSGELPQLRRVMPGRKTKLIGSLAEFDQLVSRIGSEH